MKAILFIILIDFVLFIIAYYLFLCKESRLHVFYNFITIFKFLLFYIIIFMYYIFYLILYNVFFFFKHYKFFNYYFKSIGASFFYYKKKSIYFLFWRYLVIYIISNFFFLFFFIFNLVNIKIMHFIKQLFLLSFLFFKVKYFINIFFMKKWIHVLYKIYIYILYNIFHLINIDECFLLLSKFKINIFNILKNKKDPISNRNINLVLFNKFFIFYKNVTFNNCLYYISTSFQYLIKFRFLKIILLNYMIWIVIYFYKEREFNIEYFLSKFYILVKNKNNILNIVLYFIKIASLCFYTINLVIINVIYNIILYIIYLIYVFIILLKKIKKLVLFIFLVYFFVKYYWFFLYYFYLIYKHYFLYIPIYDIKESTRFFSFEWIDLRNYFNIIFLHNNIVPLMYSSNNIIYNDLYNNINKLISTFGFKLNYQYDLQLYAITDNVLNKDTQLLNRYVGHYNTTRSYKLLKWYKKMRKIIRRNFFALNHFKRIKKKKAGAVSHASILLKYQSRQRVQDKLKNTTFYTRLNKNLLFRDHEKKMFRTWKKAHKLYIRKRVVKTVTHTIPYYRKLNRIPLKAIHVFNFDKYAKNKRNFNYYARKIRRYFVVMTNIRHHTIYFYKWWKKLIKRNHYELYFRCYHAIDYKKNMGYKHKIPNFQWTAIRWRRRFPNHFFLSPMKLKKLDETHTWHNFYETKRKKLKRKNIFRIWFIKYKFPFRLNNNKSIITALNNNKIVSDYMKIIKKYYYIKGLRRIKRRYFYRRLIMLRNIPIIIKFMQLRREKWQEPFRQNLYNPIGYDFWNFFDYLKVDKFYNIKEKKKKKYKGNLNVVLNFNLFFIKRSRKEYIKLRNILLRYYSFYLNYYYLRKVNYKHYYYAPKKPKYVKRDRAFHKWASFRGVWYRRLTSTNYKNDIAINIFKNISFLSLKFKRVFYVYFIYCDFTINKYNELYYIKVKNYRLRTLNKINNLKRFFYLHNKRKRGWSIFKYLNSFFFSFYIKHFLWHSPYSFLNLNNYNNVNIIDIKNDTYYFLYEISNIGNKIDIEIDLTRYSFIFNLYSNVIIINDFWCLQQDSISIENLIIPNNIFIIYYNNGHHKPWIMTLYITDIYRLLMTYLFYYYKNFLYRLTRYSYILKYKNYTLLDFFKRYFKVVNLYKHWYFRYRTQIGKKTMYGRFLKRRIRKFFPKKNLFVNKIYHKQLVPFWFIYNYYIKLYVYYLLNKIYIKQFFIYYLLINNIHISKGFLIFNILNYYYFKYICIYVMKYFLMYNYIDKDYKAFYYKMVINFKYAKYYFYKLYICLYSLFICNNLFRFERIQFSDNNVNYDHFVFILLWIFNKKKDVTVYRYWLLLDLNKMWNEFNNWHIATWYLYKLFNININYTLIFKGNKNIILKWMVLMANNFLEYNIKNLILVKIYLYKIIIKISDLILNTKNRLKYFKSNYIPFRKQRNYRFKRRLKAKKRMFVHTIVMRNIYSFRHLTINVNYFRNIYLVNIYNYIYLLNCSINNGNIFSLFFYFFKYNVVFYNILFYIIIYCIVLLVLNLIYYRFFCLLFFCEKVDNNYQTNWFKKFKESKTKNEINLLKKVWLKKKNNYYKFFLNNTFLNKLTIYEKFLYKTMFLKKTYNGYYQYNNNEISEGLSSISIWPFNYFVKYFKFLQVITKKPFIIKQEDRIYKFYFLDSFNLNLMNFCCFYWLLLVPYFFFEYILLKYHLKGHKRIKRRFILLLKVFLNNFKLYINIFKLIGRHQYSGWKVKYPKTYKGIRIRAKKKMKHGYFFKWNRFSKTYLKMTTLGPYYYWFFKINRYEYFLNFYKYYLNFSIKSNYFKYVYFYVIIFFLIKRRCNMLLQLKSKYKNVFG